MLLSVFGVVRCPAGLWGCRGCVGHGGGVVYNGSRDICGWLWSSRGIVHSGKNLVSVFQGFSASTSKAYILAGALGAGLSFYGI